MEGEGKLTQRRDESKKKKRKCGRRRRDGHYMAGWVGVCVGVGTGAHEWTMGLKRGGEVRMYAGSCRSPVSL